MPPVWLSILPLLIIASAGLLVFISGACCRKRPARLFMAIAGLAVAASGLAAILVPAESGTLFNMLTMDGYALFYIVIIAIITSITLLFSFQYTKIRGLAGDEFFGLILFAALAMMLIVCASHWLSFFLGLEMLSLCLYVLIAIRPGDVAGGEAALKYFVMGAVANSFLAFGIAVLYAATGGLEIGAGSCTAAGRGSQGLDLLGLGLILVGIGFKLSLVPFHLWAPDVYQGAPAPVAAFLSAGSKVAVMAYFLRLAASWTPAAGVAFHTVLWAMAAATMITGNITALVQQRLKRLLAYSSIAQMGYLLMALLAVREDGGRAVMFYSAVYAVMELGAFGVIGLLSGSREDRDELEHYRGLGFVHPWPAALLALCLLTLAGLPPTAGLIGKFIIFQAAIKSGMPALTAIAILTAMVSVFFYLKVVVLLYTSATSPATTPAEGTGPTAGVACLAIAALLLWLGLLPASMLVVIDRIAGLSFLP